MWDWSKNQIEIIFFRHGMTIENEQHRYLGNTDTSLSRNGICKLQALQKNGTYPKTDILFCSPMKRCTETAEILYPNHTPIYIPEWREMDFGEFEGKNYIELQKNPNYQAWIDSNGIMAFPGGESKEECAVRNLEGFQRAVTTCIRENISEAALVVHGGTIMNIMEAYALPKKEFYEWHVGNGCGYLVELEPALWKKDRRVLQVLETRNKQ